MDGKVLLFQIGKKKLLQTFVHSVPTDTNAGAGVGATAGSASAASSIADTAGLALPNPPPRKAASSASAASASASAATTKTQQDHDHDISEAEFGDYDEENMMDGDDEEGDEGGTLSVECVGFSSPDLKWVASGGLDKTMKVWDMVSGSCRCVCVHGGSVIALKWHAVLPIVTTASLDRAVRLWDARGGNKQTKQSLILFT